MKETSCERHLLFFINFVHFSFIYKGSMKVVHEGVVHGPGHVVVDGLWVSVMYSFD